MKWIFLLVLMFPLAAQAGMAGVGNATVEEGVWTLNVRNAYLMDDGPAEDARWRSRLMADYGVTDDYAVGLYLQGDRRQHDNLEVDAVMLDQRFELHEVEHDGFYSGMRVRYSWKDGDKKPDDAHVRFILGMPYGNWDFRVNQLLGWEIGEGRTPGTIVDSRGQVTYAYHGPHRFGFETLHNFGNRTAQDFDAQQHEVGPVFQGRLGKLTSYEAGYRHGISDRAPDHTLRFFLIHAF